MMFMTAKKGLSVIRDTFEKSSVPVCRIIIAKRYWKFSTLTPNGSNFYLNSYGIVSFGIAHTRQLTMLEESGKGKEKSAKSDALKIYFPQS